MFLLDYANDRLREIRWGLHCVLQRMLGLIKRLYGLEYLPQGKKDLIQRMQEDGDVVAMVSLNVSRF